MTLENVRNLTGLFSVIGKCNKDVFLVSPEGDKINLKSRLSQYLALAGAFTHGYVRSMSLEFEDPEDEKKVMAFISSGDSLKED